MCSHIQSCLCFTFSAVCLFLILLGVQSAEGNFNSSANGTHVRPDLDRVESRPIEADYIPSNSSAKALAEKRKYEYMLQTNEISDEVQWQHVREDGCHTAPYSYGCCYDIPGVKFLVCFNITYLPHDYGLNITVKLGEAVFNEEVSLRNPPPMCLDSELLIPYKVGSICVRIHDIDVTATTVHFCAKFLIQFLIKSIYTKELGCVDIPIKESDLLQHQRFLQ